MDKYVFRSRWKVFSKELKVLIVKSKDIFDLWRSRVVQYFKFKRELNTVERKQKEFRAMMERRRRINKKERIKFIFRIIRTGVQRIKFLKMKKASLTIQKHIAVTQFVKLANGRMAMRELMYEIFEDLVWKECEQIIYAKNAKVIQDIFRGYLDRFKHSQEVNQLAEYKKNYRRIVAINKLKGFFKGNYVRKIIKNLRNSSIVIQSRWRKERYRKAYLELRKATIKIQVGTV